MEHVDNTLIKLRKMIAKGGFDHAGRIPPERALASKLGIGRRSLRRALEILEREGHLSRQRGRGTFLQGGHNGKGKNGIARAVGPARDALPAGAPCLDMGQIIDHTNPLEVIEVRLAVEPVTARLAAYRASQTEIARLQEAAEKTRVAVDSGAYEQADHLFHRLIAEAARNWLFLAIFDTLHESQRDAGWRRLGENAHCFKRQSVYANFHAEISEAIAARNGERAHDLMLRHLGDVQKHLHEHAFPTGARPQ
ncbi:MAG: FadR/GntR family transcriptional regulator [Dongiaceae bacterium]